MLADLNPASAPYGSYSLDTTFAECRAAFARDPAIELGQMLTCSATISVWLFKNSVKKSYMGPNFDLKRVLEVIYAAGDCSVPIFGRVFDHDNRIAS